MGAMLEILRMVRRGRHLFAVDGDGREWPIPQGGSDDDPDDDEPDNPPDDEDPDDPPDDDPDDEPLGAKGKAALDRERKARRKAERENRQLRRQLKTQPDDKTDDPSADVSAAVRERAAARAERYALRAGVDPDRVDRFVRLVDLDDVIDGTSIDFDELKETVGDTLDDFPEFKPETNGGREGRDHGDPDAGPRRTPQVRPMSERVETNLDRIARRTGIRVAPRP